jgi:hypothetical protein
MEENGLRFVSVISVIAVASAAAQEDPRVAILVRQLRTSKDVRVRAQTVLLLGQTGSEAAVKPVCESLGDAEPVVRSASAGALGALRLPAAAACLVARSKETDPTVRAEIQRARAMGVVPFGAVYLSLAPVEDHGANLSRPLIELAETAMRDKLAALRVALAPVNEGKKEAATFVRTRNLRAFELRLRIGPGPGARGLKAELLIMTYPDQALKGAWNVKGGGGRAESLIKLMVPRVLDDAAADLEWKP